MLFSPKILDFSFNEIDILSVTQLQLIYADINNFIIKMENNLSNKTLEMLAHAHIRDLKSKRRWKIVFRSFVAIILLMLVVSGLFNTSARYQPHVALIKVDGIIADDAQANADSINKSLDQAFKNEETKAVIVQINSPGGSPVQSDEIYSHMRYLQKENPKILIYAVCTDVCASGGYYIALGAKNIYVNKMTITGSIGVIGSGFGFTGLIDKLGIERRTYTSGSNKNFLDPFSPQVPAQTKEFEKILQETHQVFIDAVVESRGDRLINKSESSTFSGEPFGGIQAKKIGLVDGFMSSNDIRKQKYNNIPFVDYTQPLDLFTSISSKIGGGIYYKALSESNILLH